MRRRRPFASSWAAKVPTASSTRRPRRPGSRPDSRATRPGRRASWPWQRTRPESRSPVLPSIPDERLQALGEFICADPRRVHAAAQLLRRDAGGPVESEVRGMSMGTVIPDGARIRIDSSATALTTGTVIAFVAGGRTVVHRIRWQRRTGRARGWLITQGDAMRLPDMPVARNALVGRVVAVRGEDGTWRPLAVPPPWPRRDRAL